MSHTLADSILALDFPEDDVASIAELNSKANEGALTEREAAELETYVNVADLPSYWQFKARQTLQQST
jgi:hypothetical protein